MNVAQSQIKSGCFGRVGLCQLKLNSLIHVAMSLYNIKVCNLQTFVGSNCVCKYQNVMI